MCIPKFENKNVHLVYVCVGGRGTDYSEMW